MPYATVADLRQYLKQAKADQDTEDTLEAILERASAFVDGEIGHGWSTVAASTRTLYGDGTSYLALPADYVAGSVTTVTTIAGYTVPSYVEQDGMLIVTDSDGRRAVSQVGYTAQLAARTLWGQVGSAGYAWQQGVPYTVAASFGYGAIPADLVEVVLEVAGSIWKEKDGGFATVIGVEGGGAVNIRNSLTPRAERILAHHKASSSGVGVW